MTLLGSGSPCPVLKEEGSGRGTRQYFKAMWSNCQSGDSYRQGTPFPGLGTSRGQRRALEDTAFSKGQLWAQPCRQGHPHLGTRETSRAGGVAGKLVLPPQPQAGLCHFPSLREQQCVCLGVCWDRQWRAYFQDAPSWRSPEWGWMERWNKGPVGERHCRPPRPGDKSSFVGQ